MTDAPRPTPRSLRLGTHAAMAALVQLLTRQPRTRTELSDLLGMRHETITAMLVPLVDEGLVDVTEVPSPSPHGRWTKLYTWVPQTP